ncbi:hypothetical protein EST38_g14415 [Candolleomyces aberdarensis]|uniref:Uncharacterized protein n=1 Tax=Candolleomyces aberdarensis TaxID=2316362 RepID=A0A4Q2CXB7_9AGAR|nr:hypothetical protein EST38_g14415 [Candolleomyces aberdarensis]
MAEQPSSSQAQDNRSEAFQDERERPAAPMVTIFYIDQSSSNVHNYYNSQNQTTTETTNSNNDNSTRARNSSLNGDTRSTFQAERTPSQSYPTISKQYSPAGRMDDGLTTRAPEFSEEPQPQHSESVQMPTNASYSSLAGFRSPVYDDTGTGK